MARYDVNGYGSDYVRRQRGRGVGPGHGSYGREGGRYGREYRHGQERPDPATREGLYGREFRKSRWQTAYGDPFGDRERGAPIRVIRGHWGGYGRELYGRRRGRGHDYESEYRRRYR
ncbi:MAG TPA: hypothetical protein VIL13_05680 [Longimicrobiales bacterium]